jgi:hypothetical protein
MRHTVRSLMAVLAAVSAVGVFLAGAGVAQADSSPTSLELLQKCNNGTDVCVFHPNRGPQLYSGNPHQIGTTLFNCGPGSATKSVSWSDSTGESNSVGVSFIIANEGDIAGAFAAFKSELEISYGHRWGSTDTTTRTTNVTVSAGQKGWLVRQTPMQRVTGTYELHFGYRFYGHYYWYIPFTVTGPAPGRPDVVSQRSAAMTNGAKEQCR